jgi:hypothetical protein
MVPHLILVGQKSNAVVLVLLQFLHRLLAVSRTIALGIAEHQECVRKSPTRNDGPSWTDPGLIGNVIVR